MPHPASVATGANVRAEMARHGVTQAAVATVLGVTQPAVSKRLRGDVPFDVNELTALAAFLDVPLDTLLAGVAA